MARWKIWGKCLSNYDRNDYRGAKKKIKITLFRLSGGKHLQDLSPEDKAQDIDINDTN